MTSIDGLVSSDKFKEMLPRLFVEQFKIIKVKFFFTNSELKVKNL